MTDEFVVPGFDDAVLVGRGGFGAVFRARQQRTGRLVAVKVLDAPLIDADSRVRFSQEALALGTLSSHPHIVTLLSAGVAPDGRAFLILEYLEGGTLMERAQRSAVAWQDAVTIGVKLAGALETAHRLRILHRDVKPENVLLAGSGEPLLGDFGIARVSGLAVTRVGTRMLSPAHAAPEVLSGASASARSDVYSLASTLHTLMRGAAPFGTSGSLESLIHRVKTQPAPDLTTLGVPADVAAVIDSAMAKDPNQRPPTALAFAEGLGASQERHRITRTRPVVVALDIDSLQTPQERTMLGATILFDGVAAPAARRWWGGRRQLAAAIAVMIGAGTSVSAAILVQRHGGPQSTGLPTLASTVAPTSRPGPSPTPTAVPSPTPLPSPPATPVPSPAPTAVPATQPAVTPNIQLPAVPTGVANPTFRSFAVPQNADGTANYPASATLGPDGRIWFVETGGGRVGEVSATGAFLMHPLASTTDEPTQVVLGPDANMWVAVDVFGAAGRIERVTAAGLVTAYGLSGTATPYALVQGGDGAMWFAEKDDGQNGSRSPNGRIGRITTAGALTEVILPAGMAVTGALVRGADGNLWFADPARQAVGRLTSTGAATEFPVNEAIATLFTDGARNVYGEVSQGGGTSVVAIARVGRDGTAATTPLSHTLNDDPAVVAPDGTIWMADCRTDGSCTLNAVRGDGRITVFPFLAPPGAAGNVPGPSGPRLDCLGPGGTLWASDSLGYTGGRIWRIQP